MPAISVIMPAFNSQETISRAVESFRYQTFPDWELIIIDDGSTDNTPHILDDLAAADSRIKVIHKPNGGVASARQVGIESAMGEYSIHADSDDWVETDMLEKMYTTAKRTNADMVVADFFINYPDGRQEIRRQKLDSYYPCDVIYQLYAKDLFGGLWHKLLRTAIYTKAKVSFEARIDFCEDKLLLTKILYRCPDIKIVYHPKAFYHYMQTPISITRKISHHSFECMKRFHEMLPQYLPDEPRFTTVRKTESLKMFLNGFIYNIFTTDEISREFSKVKPQAYKTQSIRWLIGYLCIDLHLYKIARLFIKY
ncbi:glycosyltransferase family 2 protein [Alistipes provencensis]|uniref:glycosyltransferase family 2 protein n=1 Tax=Alistipes provencensis TaxID=1816676 RepID=UPI0007ED1F8A|nr:glycosyltransferase family 2 protein [Alistipes provencensis]